MKHTHLNALKIRGFRGLSSLDLDSLGTFNILLGANDVGKTSILEAIFLLSGSANMQLPLQIQTFRNYEVREFADLSALFHELDFNQPITLKAHYCDSTRLTLGISAPYEPLATKIQSDEPPSDPSSSSVSSGRRHLRYDGTVQNASQQEPLSFSGRLIERDDNLELTKMPDALADNLIAASFIGARFQYNSSVIGEIIVDKKKNELLRYLRIINPHVKEIAVSGDKAYLDIGLKKMMPLNMFGSGMIRAATMLSLSILRAEQLLLIDELENGLHYQAIPPLLKTLLKFSSDQHLQIFATTHSLEILKGLKDVLSLPEFSDYTQTTNCYTLQRDKSGLVRSYKYGYSQFEHVLEHGIEIR